MCIRDSIKKNAFWMLLGSFWIYLLYLFCSLCARARTRESIKSVRRRVGNDPAHTTGDPPRRVATTCSREINRRLQRDRAETCSPQTRVIERRQRKDETKGRSRLGAMRPGPSSKASRWVVLSTTRSQSRRRRVLLCSLRWTRRRTSRCVRRAHRTSPQT